MWSVTDNLDRNREEIESLGERTDDLKRTLLPDDHYQFTKRRQSSPKRSPLDELRSALKSEYCVIGWHCLAFLNGAYQFAFQPDGRVFVARHDGELHVWESARAFKKDTGRDMRDFRRQDYEFMATSHGAKRRDLGIVLVLLGVGLVILVRSVLGTRRQLKAHGVPPAIPTANGA
jgi:hypothetical protein